MKISHGKIPGLLVIEPVVFGDARGHFFESFHQEKFNSFIGCKVEFVQDNQSLSSEGILRGLHYQAPPFAQGKLVRVAQGAVLDIALDIRKNSSTYGQFQAIELNEQNKLLFYIPCGFAHGFLSLKDNTIFQYKCTNYYHPASEGAVRWNSEELQLPWNVNNPLVSEKDQLAPSFNDFISPFL
jgi:dTDP-4-dehydrorhamnose 3,5-epimerase